MKTKYFIATVILVFAGSLFNGCNNNRDKVEDAKENVLEAKNDLNDTKTQFEKDWQQFKSDIEIKINTNEEKIAEFKAEIKTASGKYKSKYENEVVALEQKNLELRKKLNDYKYNGNDNWQAFKNDFNHEVDILIVGLNDIIMKKD